MEHPSTAKFGKIIGLIYSADSGEQPSTDMQRAIQMAASGPRASSRVYVACPTRGFDYEAVRIRQHEAAQRLAAKGFSALLPAELINDPEADAPHRRPDTMAACVAGMLSCGSIYLLEGWQQSEGCLIEWEAAKIAGLAIYTDENINTLAVHE